MFESQRLVQPHTRLVGDCNPADGYSIATLF